MAGGLPLLGAGSPPAVTGARKLRELGLTTAEANAILLADREERRGIAARTPEGRASWETRMARVCLTVGLVAAAGFLLAVLYLIRDAGAHSGQPPTAAAKVANAEKDRAGRPPKLAFRCRLRLICGGRCGTGQRQRSR